MRSFERYWRRHNKSPEEVNRILKNFDPDEVRRILKGGKSKKIKVKKIHYPLRGTVTYTE